MSICIQCWWNFTANFLVMYELHPLNIKSQNFMIQAFNTWTVISVELPLDYSLLIDYYLMLLTMDLDSPQ